MGLFSFFKDAGKKLRGDDTPPKAEELKRDLDTYNLGTQNVKVNVDGDKVLLQGQVKDQAAFEKAVLAVGNAHGVSQVNTDNLTVANKPAAAPVFYTVKSGDSLWKIAEAHYGKGNGDKYNIIFDANRPMLDSPDKIYPGQVLRIPALETVTSV